MPDLDHFIPDHPQADVLWHCKARSMPSGEVCEARALCKHFKAQTFNFIYDRYAPEPMTEKGCAYFLRDGVPDQREEFLKAKELLGRGKVKA